MGGQDTYMYVDHLMATLSDKNQQNNIKLLQTIQSQVGQREDARLASPLLRVLAARSNQMAVSECLQYVFDCLRGSLRGEEVSAAPSKQWGSEPDGEERYFLALHCAAPVPNGCMRKQSPHTRHSGLVISKIDLPQVERQH